MTVSVGSAGLWSGNIQDFTTAASFYLFHIQTLKVRRKSSRKRGGRIPRYSSVDAAATNKNVRNT